MYRSKTLFVVGAGASAEVNLPTGAGLTTRIAQYVTRAFQASDGDADPIGAAMHRSLLQHAGQSGHRSLDLLVETSLKLTSAMTLSASIDNYVDAHRNDPAIELIAKVSIAAVLIDAERQSLLYSQTDTDDHFSFAKIADTWYVRFFRLLCANIAVVDVSQLFSNVRFIIFNYDRCVERFLRLALTTYYGLPEQQAAEIVNGCILLHPYGVLGEFPPNQHDTRGVPYGGRRYANNYNNIIPTLKTSHQSIEDKSFLTAIQRTVGWAEHIVFLGFGFHQQNMDLLAVKNSSVRRVFSSTYRISTSDKNVIYGGICTALNKRDGVQFDGYPAKCTDLFDEFSRSISA